MTAWLAKVDPVSKVIAAFLTVAVLGMTLGGWPGIPAQVDVNTAAITRDSLDIHSIQSTLDDVICILIQPEGANPLECIRETP